MSADIMPFGALPQFAGLSPDDLARLARSQQPAAPSPVDGLLFDRAGMGGQGGFSGTSGTIVPPAAPAQPEPETEAPAPRAMPAPPVRPLTFGSLPAPAPAAPAQPEPETEAPAPRAMPAPPVRPLTFGSLPAPAPTAPAQPTPAPSGPAPATTGSVAPSPAAASEPSLGDRFWGAIKANGDLMGSLGYGLLSTRGFGAGLAAGLKNYDDTQAKKAVTNLAQAEFGLKAQKAQQEQRQLTGNAQYVTSKIPGISPEHALTLGGNSTFMNELFKGVLPPSELYKQYTDDKGNIWNQNARTGQATVALKADDDKTVTPVAEADRVALGLPAGSYQKDANGKISPINPTGTTINMGGEKAYDAEVGKTYAKQFSDLMTSDRNAGAKLNSLALMEQQMGQPGFYSGFGGEQVKRVNQLLGALGIKDPKAASGAEAVAALSNQVALDQLGGSLGAGVSNPDRDFIVEIGPGLGKTPEGNKQLIGIYRAMAQRQQQVGQMARDYAKANGGRIDAGFDEQVSRFANENPLFPAASRAAQAQSDGVSGPTAAPGVAAPRTQADFDALPKGAMYVDPSDGRRYRKN